MSTETMSEQAPETANESSETPNTEVEGPSTAVLIGGIVAMLLVGGIGLFFAIQQDKAKCEELFGKFSVLEPKLDRATQEYEIKLAVVLNRGIDPEKDLTWTATYAGKTFTNADADTPARLVSQYGRETERVGLLGSDLKRLYGASYKQFYFKFYAKWLGDDAQPLKITGKIKDPKRGDQTFTVETTLK